MDGLAQISCTAFLEVSEEVVLKIQADRYDLQDPLALARFLQDADIRLVRAKFGPQLLISGISWLQNRQWNEGKQWTVLLGWCKLMSLSYYI